jgi:hypothetical protein
MTLVVGLEHNVFTLYIGPRLEEARLAYTAVNSRGATYYLHAKHVTLTNGREQTQFYFAPSVRRGEGHEELPVGHIVREDPRNGRLTVKRADLVL